MKIQHNIPALTTYRNLQSSQVKLQKHASHLASGIRINQAADDAAGLSISEKMRSQIRGLTQASRNIQDSISLLQASEGAMNEIHELLQRGRELSVQASNDTSNMEDKKQIQGEIAQIINEIDGVSHRTEFNGMKLLRGSSTVLPPLTGGGTGSGGSWSLYPPASDSPFTSNNDVTNALQTYMLRTPEQQIAQYYGISAPAGTAMDVVYQNDAAGGAVAWVSSAVYISGPGTGKATDFSLTIDTADFVTGSNLWISKDRIVAHEMVHAVMGASGINMLDSAMPDWFKEGVAEYLPGADERLAGSLSILGTPEAVVNSINGPSNSSHFYSAAYVAVKYMDTVLQQNGSSIKDLMMNLADGSLKTLDAGLREMTDGNGQAIFSNGLTTFMDSYLANGAQYINDFIDLNTNDGNGDSDGVGSIMGPLSDGNVVPDDFTNPSDQPLQNFTLNWTTSTGYTSGSPNVVGSYVAIWKNTFAELSNLHIQLGANAGQGLEIKLNRIDSTTLGVNGADVIANPSTSITQFDEAIQLLSNERSRFGAFQNRLEHAQKVVENSAENLTSAESRIRDVDMAKEMMGHTKESILSQAAQAMLAKANQDPQGILQLLR